MVADHTKLGRRTFAQIAPFGVAHTLITDRHADPDVVRQFERAGLRVIVAQPGA